MMVPCLMYNIVHEFRNMNEGEFFVRPRFDSAIRLNDFWCESKRMLCTSIVEPDGDAVYNMHVWQSTKQGS